MNTSNTSNTSNTEQKEIENEASQAKEAREVLPDFARNAKHVDNLLQQLNLVGLQREYEVCMAVQRVHIIDFKLCSAWNTCNLTGEMCADSMHFLCDGVSYNIHKRFAYFVYCLWTCTHITKLQQEVVGEVAAAEKNALVSSETGIGVAGIEVAGIGADTEGGRVLPEHTLPTARVSLHNAYNVAYSYVCDVLRGTLAGGV